MSTQEMSERSIHMGTILTILSITNIHYILT